MSSKSVELLEEMGLTKYESTIYAALVSHGPSGVGDINRYTGIARNKIYETLDLLSKRGIVQFQPGRPVIFKAVSPKLTIPQFVSDYSKKARDALSLLLEEEASGQEVKTENFWVMSTNKAIKQKLAEEIIKSKKSFFALEAYPPDFLIDVKSVLRAAAERGVTIRAVSIIDPASVKIASLPEKNLIEYRTIQKTDLDKKAKHADGDVLTPLRQMSRIGGSYIIDDACALNVLKNDDNDKSTGILISVPVMPALQRISLEGFVENYTQRM
jgi:sugar-specific transcriptional regulator TrmB